MRPAYKSFAPATHIACARIFHDREKNCRPLYFTIVKNSGMRLSGAWVRDWDFNDRTIAAGVVALPRIAGMKPLVAMIFNRGFAARTERRGLPRRTGARFMARRRGKG
jgi:hypothetical protein